MNLWFSLLKNMLISILIFFIGLLIPTTLEYFDLLSFNLEIYPWIILTIAALTFTYLNVKAVNKMGILVGLISGIVLFIMVLVILSVFAGFQPVPILDWKIFVLFGITSIWGAIIVNI